MGKIIDEMLDLTLLLLLLFWKFIFYIVFTSLMPIKNKTKDIDFYGITVKISNEIEF